MDYDIIEPLKSPWACSVVMAKKEGQVRICCDFRHQNAVLIKDAYPIPRINESLSKLGDAKFFMTLNLDSAFWQVQLRKWDREKMVFACELGLFKWKKCRLDYAKRRPHSNGSWPRHSRIWLNIWKPHNVLCWWRGDRNTNPGGPYRDTGRSLYLHEAGRPEM